ncbi:hypothetical protein CTRI78_v006913 [Colletotrichum trifolii]|uniref:Uncharacterized protein n=1 Tax=Colletotrichum trifolii TaxID=5466 RepID=A0A4R8RB44_COLTR|nr:hypothetical protein CTRI78_v006913 [Colletotrichum trifolii]
MFSLKTVIALMGLASIVAAAPPGRDDTKSCYCGYEEKGVRMSDPLVTKEACGDLGTLVNGPTKCLITIDINEPIFIGRCKKPNGADIGYCEK